MFSTCERLHPCGIGDKSSMTQAHINLAGLHASRMISAHNNTACISTTTHNVKARQPDHHGASETDTLLY